MQTPKRYRSEPPEGGWGYLVGIGLAIPFIQILGVLPSFTLIYGEFFKTIGAGTSDITLITSVFFASMSFVGLFINSLYKKFTLRLVAVFGAILYFAGSVCQIFVTSTGHLLVSFSLMQGIASGLIIPALFTTFNCYFVKRRATMMNLAQTLVGVGTMFYPVVVQKLQVEYGFRGCLIVLAALNSHAIFGTLVLHPVQWHMKRVEITEQEMKELSSTKSEDKHEPEQQAPLINSTEGELMERPLKEFRSRAASVASVGSFPAVAVVSDQIVPNKTKNLSIWQKIVDHLDLTLLKKPVYVNIVLGITFALYSDITFFTLQPMYLDVLGFSKADKATVVAIGAGADLVSRIVLSVGVAFLPVSSRTIYLLGGLLIIIARWAFLSVKEFMGMAIVTGIIGFFKTWIHAPLPLVFAEYLSVERFPSGYGLFMFMSGNIMCLIGPVVGYIRDQTQNYALTFHILNFIMALCVVPWIIELVYLKCIRRKQIDNKNGINMNIA